MQPKGIDTTEIDYFGKLIMCSNNENNFIPLEESDIRFFIIKVKKFEQEDPDFLDKNRGYKKNVFRKTFLQ